jgi:hypothetical protein
MAGRVVTDGPDACFVPGFPFVDGTEYVVESQGQAMARLVRPPRPAAPAACVMAVRPSAVEVPRNLLRIYVWFSAPMSEGVAAGHLRLLDEDGAVMEGSIMPSEYELWDAERRRLTILLDPARIKRGLTPHQEIGYPLQEGRSFTLVIDAAFPDARGIAMLGGAEQRYRAGSDERRTVDPGAWGIISPLQNSADPVRFTFDRPLDHALLLRCLRVLDPAGQSVRGAVSIGPGEGSWSLTPSGPWKGGWHTLMVDPVLEDVAGNSVTRAFDQEWTGARPAQVHAPLSLRFEPRPVA